MDQDLNSTAKRISLAMADIGIAGTLAIGALGKFKAMCEEDIEVVDTPRRRAD